MKTVQLTYPETVAVIAAIQAYLSESARRTRKAKATRAAYMRANATKFLDLSARCEALAAVHAKIGDDIPAAEARVKARTVRENVTAAIG